MNIFKKSMGLLLIAVVLLLLSCTETMKTSYETRNEARMDGAIERGWIPRIIPESAYDISEIHNLDNNQVTGEFYYAEVDENHFLSHLTSIGGSYSWGYFIFEIDIENNLVTYKNF